MADDKQYTREELEVKLTPKEKVFCEEYVVDWNKSRAARVAGYSEEWAGDIGYQNSKKLYIQQYIDFIKNDLERLSGITKLKNLKELAKIAFSSIAHLHNTWIEKTAFELLTDDQKAAIETIETKTVTVNFDELTKEIEFVKVSLYNKQAAISEINKMMGYNAAEKIENKQTIQFQNVSKQFPNE